MLDPTARGRARGASGLAEPHRPFVVQRPDLPRSWKLRCLVAETETGPLRPGIRRVLVPLRASPWRSGPHRGEEASRTQSSYRHGLEQFELASRPCEERTYASLLPLRRDSTATAESCLDHHNRLRPRRGKPRADQPSVNNVRGSRNLDCNRRWRRSRSCLWPAPQTRPSLCHVFSARSISGSHLPCLIVAIPT
jgi:hypothetical protein